MPESNHPLEVLKRSKQFDEYITEQLAQNIKQKVRLDKNALLEEVRREANRIMRLKADNWR